MYTSKLSLYQHVDRNHNPRFAPKPESWPNNQAISEDRGATTVPQLSVVLLSQAPDTKERSKHYRCHPASDYLVSLSISKSFK